MHAILFIGMYPSSSILQQLRQQLSGDLFTTAANLRSSLHASM
jgi:hypothetical protein